MRVKVVQWLHAGPGEPGFGGAAVPPTPAFPRDKRRLQRLKPRSGPGRPRPPEEPKVSISTLQQEQHL